MRVWLREKRLSNKKTEAEIAVECGIAQPFYHNIEAGIKNPSVITAQKIGKVLDFNWTLFFTEPEDK